MKPFPNIVERIAEAVSRKLGRESTIRKVNNFEQYFILDLSFSYFQKADRNRRNDYRSGFQYFKDGDEKNCLIFNVSHSPIMFSFLAKNFDYKTFKEVVRNTAKFRDSNFITYKHLKETKTIAEKETETFLIELEKVGKSRFDKVAFSKNNSSEKGIGNIFSIGIARDFNETQIDEIIEMSWELFMWLYPSKPLFGRNASLNRNLQKLERICEVSSIRKLPKEIIGTKCNGPIEGAHIKPHKLGGSDKLENGLWLCSTHHKLTEGKIKGNRTMDKIKVSYSDQTSTQH